MTSNRSADLHSTLNSVAESGRLCEADDTIILRTEDDHFCVAAHYGCLSALSRTAFPDTKRFALRAPSLSKLRST
jgi:hypothetical protein